MPRRRPRPHKLSHPVGAPRSPYKRRCAPAPPKHPGTPQRPAGSLITAQPWKDQAPVSHPHSSLPSHLQVCKHTHHTQPGLFPQSHRFTLTCIFRLLVTYIDSTGKFCTTGNVFLTPLPTHTYISAHTKLWLQEIQIFLWKLKNSRENEGLYSLQNIQHLCSHPPHLPHSLN